MRAITEKFFNVFSQEGMQNHIRGFEFNIDTGKCKPICCKQPQDGPHKSWVILVLVEKLERKGIIEDDNGPWGSPVILASKPDQAHVHWSEFVFRLCISYRMLNTVPRSSTFLITRCDEAVERVGDTQYYITADLDAGYWQVKMNESSKDRPAFFSSDGKKDWNSMQMGAMNTYAFFVAMVSKMEIKWNALYRVRTKKRKEIEWDRLTTTDGRSNSNNKGKTSSIWASERTWNPKGKSRRIESPLTSQRSTFLSHMAESRRTWPATRLRSQCRQYHSIRPPCSFSTSLLFYMYDRNSSAPWSDGQVEKDTILPSKSWDRRSRYHKRWKLTRSIEVWRTKRIRPAPVIFRLEHVNRLHRVL